MLRAAHKVQFVLAVLGCFGAGSLYGWSGYLPAVRAQFGISNAASSMVFSLALVSFTFGVLLGPVLLARVPRRFRLPAVTGLAALGLVGAGASPGFAGFAVAYGVLFGFAAGSLYNYTVSLASASGAPALFVPISVAAFGLGGAVFGPLQVWLTAAGFGVWSNAPALGCLTAVACAALIVRDAPKTAVAEQPAEMAITKPNRTLAKIWIIFAAGSCSGLIVLGFAAQILPQASGGVGLAGLAIFLAALGNTLGRLCSAVTARAFGPARAIAGALVLSMISVACLLLTDTPGVVVWLLFLVAFAYGQLAATTPLLVKSHVPPGAFSSAFGWVFTGWGVAGLVGPWTAGWLLDATGTLRVSLGVCMGLSLLSLWLVVRFTKQNSTAETY